MTIDMLSTVSRRLARGAAVLAVAGLTVASAPAVAAPPDTWPEGSVGGTNLLLVLVVIPLALIALIALLTLLPSMVRGQSQETALTFHDRHEWFGGPRQGVPDADAAPSSEDSSSDRGGASARW